MILCHVKAVSHDVLYYRLDRLHFSDILVYTVRKQISNGIFDVVDQKKIVSFYAIDYTLCKRGAIFILKNALDICYLECVPRG